MLNLYSAHYKRRDLTRRLFVQSVASGAAVLAAPLAFASPAPWVRLADRYNVETTDSLPLLDKKRDRIIRTKIAVPREAQNCPVIIFSHGFGGDYSAFSHSVEFWASQGYIVISPTHGDSVRFSDTTSPRGQILNRIFSKSPGASSEEKRSLLVRAMEDPYYLECRLADLAFLADALARGEGIEDRVHSAARRGRFGLAGHSYGAYTAEVVAGATLSPSVRNAPQSLRDHFAAYLTISGQGSGRLGLSQNSFRPIVAPLFQITGSRDFGADGEPPEWRLQAFEDSAALNKYSALVKGFGHRDFDPPLDAPENATGIPLRNLEVAFFNAWLVDNCEARARLRDQVARSTPQDSIWLRGTAPDQ